MILLYPPVAKPSEPPAGLACLSGALRAHGILHTIIDANLEGQLHLLDACAARSEQPDPPHTPSDTWSRRAYRHIHGNLSALRDPSTYKSPDRYARAVADLERVLRTACGEGTVVSLADYHEAGCSPLRSADLLRAAREYRRNPYFEYFSERLRQAIPASASPVLGLSVNFLNQALCAFAIAGFVRQEFPEVEILMGGGLITSWMSLEGFQPAVFSAVVDRFFAGPGEEALIRHMGIEPVAQYPLPDYSQFRREEYLSPGFILPCSTSSGCWWGRCAFCPEHAQGSGYVCVPPERMAQDLRQLVSAYRPVMIHLLDNAVSVAHLRAIIQSPPGVPWYGFVRVTKELCDEGFCRELKASGCVMLKLGIESGDATVLRELHKGMTPQLASDALRMLQRVGIATYVYLLFGTPPETRDSARRTLEFTVEHAGGIGYLNLAVFNMPHGFGQDVQREDMSRMAAGDEMTAGDAIGGEDLSLYTGFRHPQGWDRRQVREFLDKEFRSHTEVGRILRRTPPVFTSNHAALLLKQ